MEEINNLTARMDQRLVLWIAGIVAVAFVALLVFDNIRRRRLHGRNRNSPSQPGFFRRTTSSFRDLRDELERREASRRRDRRK
jgi:hypothetical protein